MDAASGDASVLSVTWDSRSFFRRSILRSGNFILLVTLCVGTVALGLYVLLAYWDHLSTTIAAVLFASMLYSGVVPMVRLVQAHQRIHEMYLSGVIRDVPSDSPLAVALRLASRGLLTGVFTTLLTLILAFCIVLHFEIYTR